MAKLSIEKCENPTERSENTAYFVDSSLRASNFRHWRPLHPTTAHFRPWPLKLDDSKLDSYEWKWTIVSFERYKALLIWNELFIGTFVIGSQHLMIFIFNSKFWKQVAFRFRL